jgi:Gram-negative bacterial TonB protein C-terminal/MORN repeat variant
MQGHYVDNVQQGLWKFWFPSGRLKDSGIIKNNFFSGTWKSWYDDGTLAAIATYPNDDSITQVIYSSTYTSRKTSLFKGDTIVAIKNGLWQAFYRNGSKRDSGSFANNIKTGWWKTWYENGQPESSGYYTNNIQEGIWEYFRREGTPSTRETYKAGKVISMACYDEQGHFTDSFCSILKPPVPLLERFVTLDNYLLDHIVWPDKILNNTSIEGIVQVRFTITKEGKLIDFKILHSPHNLLSTEVERFFNSLPSWSPAISHNRTIDFTMEYEVPFRR